MEAFNTNRNVTNFGDFCNNIEQEKEKLKKVKGSIMPNSDRQQFVKNSKTEYDSITHKLTDYTKPEIDDTLDKWLRGMQINKVRNGNPNHNGNCKGSD